ncbi:MAG: hypothetical protein ABI432_06945 [Flavobacteriales bacterium]
MRRTARYHTLGAAASAREIWIVLHGYGQLARYFLSAFEGFAEDRFIIAPEGLSRFYTDDTFTRVGSSWMTREDRDEEIGDQIAYLDELVRTVRRSCPTAATVHVLGFSQGVATASRWAYLGSTAMVHLVLWGGSMPPELEADALRKRWSAMRFDLVHGADDKVVGEDKLLQNEAKFRAVGLRWETHRFPGGHELDTVILGRIIGA